MYIHQQHQGSLAQHNAGTCGGSQEGGDVVVAAGSISARDGCPTAGGGCPKCGGEGGQGGGESQGARGYSTIGPPRWFMQTQNIQDTSKSSF